MAQGFSLKDHLFNRDTVTHLGDLFAAADVFPAGPFVEQVMADMLPLELKARSAFIAQVLAAHLPADFPTAAAAIERALPPPLDPTLTDDDFGRFIYGPLGTYVENHGIDDHFASSLDLIEKLTQRFSMEFSIRPFLIRDPATVLARMRQWANHDHYHVRRLVSEGTRPRLPWGQNITLTHVDTLPLLDLLYADPTRFVTRSVANHLNDITKKHPDAVLDRLEKWAAEGRQTSKELAWMARHALRGLMKSGHPRAMRHLGFSPDVVVTVSQLALSPDTFAPGDTMEIATTFTSDRDAALAVDYVIDFVKSNGSTSPKVSKFKVLNVKANVPVTLKKRHTFKANATTFTLYPGAHHFHLQINGQIVADVPFTLT